MGKGAQPFQCLAWQSGDGSHACVAAEQGAVSVQLQCGTDAALGGLSGRCYPSGVRTHDWMAQRGRWCTCLDGRRRCAVHDLPSSNSSRHRGGAAAAAMHACQRSGSSIA
jgi:hypothetical protein